MNRLDRRREKAMQRKAKTPATAKCEMFCDGDDIEYCECTYGKNKTMFRREQFANAKALADTVMQWGVSVGARGLKNVQTQMTPAQRMQTLIRNEMFFRGMSKSLAQAAEGLDSWQDFDRNNLSTIGEKYRFSQSMMNDYFEEISNDFTPQRFCELVAILDNPQIMKKIKDRLIIVET